MSQACYMVGVYTDEDAAHRALAAVIAAGCPMDRVSVLGRLRAEGDDVLGLVHPGVGQRMQVWGANGALWGAIAGLVAGAAGVLWIPGLGAVMAAGHLAAGLASGVAGAAVGGAGLAGAAAASQLSVLLHRHGLPEDALAELHNLIAAGRVVVIVTTATGAAQRENFRSALARGRPEQVMMLD